MKLSNTCPYEQQCEQCQVRKTWLTRYRIHYVIVKGDAMTTAKSIMLATSQPMSKERAAQLIRQQLNSDPGTEILIIRIETGQTSTKCGIDNQFLPSLNCDYSALTW